MPEFLVCENFAREAQCALEKDPGLPGTIAPFPARCGRPPLALGEALTLLTGSTGAVLLGGCCVAGMCRGSACVIQSGSLELRLRRLASCFEMVADPAMVDGLLREGRYLVTAGWLACWRERLAAMGLDRPMARTLFHESATDLTLLDTGCDENSPARLVELGEYLQMPREVIPVGCGQLRRNLQLFEPPA